ncbi:MAG TPA: hypothetical protein DDW34_13255 [Clostridium sp.]|nr:hypothetical protein [Clostridium sp.]
MNYTNRKLRTIGTILSFALVAATQILAIANEKNHDKSSSESYSYSAEETAKRIKPDYWDSIYLPTALPYSYELGVSTMSDTCISNRFSRYTHNLIDRDPNLYFTQWNSIKETIPSDGSKLPPILKTGKVQTGGYKVDCEEQLEVNTNATLQPQTYNGKDYYFCDETPDNDLLLLWYDEEKTFVLRVQARKGGNGIKFTLDNLLSIADQVKEYS